MNASTHTNENPYISDVCRKGFLQSDHLIDHHWSHTKEKLFISPICFKRSIKISDLKRHIFAFILKKKYRNDCSISFIKINHEYMFTLIILIGNHVI